MKPTVFNITMFLLVFTTVYFLPVVLAKFVWIHLWWTCIPCSFGLSAWVVYLENRK